MDFIDLYITENEFLKSKKRLKFQYSVESATEIVDFFSTHGIEVTLLITKGGKILWNQREDKNVKEFLDKNGESNEFFGVLNADNDDGEEMPTIRIWWK